MTEPTRPTDPNQSPDENPTEEAMTTPTTSSPPEGDFFTQMGSPAQTETGSGNASTTGAPETPTMTYAGPQEPAPPKGPRMRSIAWGLVLALLGAVVIAVGLGVRLDLELVFIGILAVAGLTLLIGSLVSSGRKE